jgi:predicted Rossmann fold flavoprotein
VAGADVAIIGAGPAGLFCAIHAAAAGCRVLLLDKNLTPGAKLLLSGSGQCNITHAGEAREFLRHYGSHGTFLKPALLSCTNRDLMQFFIRRGLAMVTEENGKVFPESRRSADVLEVLLAECRSSGVEIRCGEPVRGITKTAGGFEVASGGSTCTAATAVITTGGASYPRCGTTGDGYRLAAALGQPVTAIAPALTPLVIAGYPFASLAGISFETAPFTLWRNGKKAGSFCGDILFTHTGLSGPGILDASREIRAGDLVRLSFAGAMPREAFSRELERRVQENGVRQVRSVLAMILDPDRLARRLLALSGIPGDLTCAHLTAVQRTTLVTNCTGFPLVVERPGDFTVAMATCGGVALDQVNNRTMESKLVPGLFFAGEVLDIDGDTGGYNLQAAFSTGFAAAGGIRKRLDAGGDR